MQNMPLYYTLRYKCANGSEFDTDSDGYGDTVMVENR